MIIQVHHRTMLSQTYPIILLLYERIENDAPNNARAIHLALTWKLAQRDKVQPSTCGYCGCENYYKSMQIFSIQRTTKSGEIAIKIVIVVQVQHCIHIIANSSFQVSSDSTNELKILFLHVCKQRSKKFHKNLQERTTVGSCNIVINWMNYCKRTCQRPKC